MASDWSIIADLFSDWSHDVRARVWTPASGRGAWVSTGARCRGGWRGCAAPSPGSSRTRRWSSTGSGGGSGTRRPGCLSSSAGTMRGGWRGMNEVLESWNGAIKFVGRPSVTVWMLWSKVSLSGTRLRTWSRQWGTSKLRKNSKEDRCVDVDCLANLEKKSRKSNIESFHLCYIWVTFILFEHKVHSPCQHKVIHGKPLQPVAMVCPPPVPVSGLWLWLRHYYEVTTLRQSLGRRSGGLSQSASVLSDN